MLIAAMRGYDIYTNRYRQLKEKNWHPSQNRERIKKESK